MKLFRPDRPAANKTGQSKTELVFIPFSANQVERAGVSGLVYLSGGRLWSGASCCLRARGQPGGNARDFALNTGWFFSGNFNNLGCGDCVFARPAVRAGAGFHAPDTMSGMLHANSALYSGF